MKKALIAIPILLIVIILALGFSLNSIVKHGVETLGPKALGAAVQLNKADISVFSGKGNLKGLYIGNPKGFQTDSALKLGAMRVALDLESIFSDKIIVNEIYIDSPDITYEKGSGGDNFNALLNNIKKFTRSVQSAGKKDAAEPEGEDKKIQINRLTIVNGKVNMSAALLGGKQVTLDLPDINMKDIGKGKEGTTLSKAMEQVFAALNKNIGSTVTASMKDIRSTVEKTVEKTVEDTVGGTVNQLKGLFGR